MSGNVAEWCQDAFFEASVPVVWDLNPTYFDTNEPRKVIRGGSWKDVAYYLQTGTRTFEYQDTATSFIGFRCAMTFLGRSSGTEF
jgi:formylglycine-generating enzyme required for sulfatase activity